MPKEEIIKIPESVDELRGSNCDIQVLDQI